MAATMTHSQEQTLDAPLLRSDFQRDGFVVIRNFLPAAEFQLLTDNVNRFIRDVVPTLTDRDAFYDDRTKPETLKQLARMEQDPFFAEYRQHPLWTSTAASLLGEPVQVHGVEWFNKPPATNHATPPHQDNFYFCLQPPQVLTMWLALDPIDEENGCLRYVPGSHQRGIRPHSRTQTLGFSQGISDYTSEDIAHEVAIIALPNDVLIHLGNTIHRANANRSQMRHRRSFAMVFQGASATRDQVAFERYLAAAKAQHHELGLKT